CRPDPRGLPHEDDPGRRSAGHSAERGDRRPLHRHRVRPGDGPAGPGVQRVPIHRPRVEQGGHDDGLQRPQPAAGHLGPARNHERTERDWYGDPVGKTGKVTVVTKTDHNFDDRPQFDYDELGNKSETVYDRAGRATKSIDPRGNVTVTVYDKRGLVVETDNPDGTVTRTAYDALGRPEYTTEPFVVGQSDPVRGSHAV